MKVILKESVYKHGVAGDVVDVADGFARNYLIPRGLAVKATTYTLRENKQLMEEAEKRRVEMRHMLDEVAQKIHGVELVFGMKAGKNNKLYGSVTTMDVARALEEKTGVDINRRRISERSLRELGIHEVPVRMSAGTSPVLKVVIVREEEVAAYLEGKPVPSLAGIMAVDEAKESAEQEIDDAIEAESTPAEAAADAVAEGETLADDIEAEPAVDSIPADETEAAETEADEVEADD
ncbi:MAG: 50S ribosomal protein L9 [Anaerolineae bacterium]|nr:50S ribosomal protein L9 [Anaerolineae bacterium]